MAREAVQQRCRFTAHSFPPFVDVLHVPHQHECYAVPRRPALTACMALISLAQITSMGYCKVTCMVRHPSLTPLLAHGLVYIGWGVP